MTQIAETIGRRLNKSAVVGYALVLIYFALFTGRANPLFYGGSDVVFSAYAHAAEVGQFCCLTALAFLAITRRSLCERALPLLALVMLVGGYTVTLNLAMEGFGEGLLPITAGALFGAGQGACFLGYFLIFSRMSLLDATLNMVASTVLSALLILGVSLAGSMPLLFSLLALVVAGSVAFLAHGLRADGPSSAHGGADADAKSVFAWLGSWAFVERRSILCLLALAFVCGAQRVVSLEVYLSQSVVPLLFSLGYAAGALAFFGLARLESSDGDDSSRYYRIYTVLLVVMATCGVLSFAQNAAVQTLLYAVDNIAFTIVSICMVMTALQASERAPMSPVVLGGLICGSMYFAIQLGRIVCNMVIQALGTDVVSGLVVSVIIIYVLALAAITSGAFVRQVAAPRHDDTSMDANTVDKQPGKIAGSSAKVEVSMDAEARPLVRSVISISSVTEKQLRENPTYRMQFGLTNREIDVLVLLLAGYNSKDISELLLISNNTVKTHLKCIYSKMAVHNRRELVQMLNEIERIR